MKYDPNCCTTKGCDTGFGLELARHLHEQGFNVYAGCMLLDSEGAADLAHISESKGKMTVLQLDVTKKEDWEDAYEVKNLMICKESGEILCTTPVNTCRSRLSRGIFGES